MKIAIYLSDVSEERPLDALLNRIARVYSMGGLPLPDTVFLESPLYKRLEFEEEQKEAAKVKTLTELAAERLHGRVLTWHFPQGTVVIRELGGAQ